ncbi:hypothetical protein T458_02970 [Brevibacillus panacihumi W25]|uniref:DUF485 domain-containing protein n=2 Tax=Brevibacillus panacihumi TaxID=497735 RepID=V6MMN0_9BACL|nr:DUF485 domain-containing protein [Brevibacillus panacihumi]EST56753.1 hypothetical protein T458_02970 [Brevibacillus panacihumi W25]RNB86445.1 DUF485 domain-containing protein [Brevibacillus panacihumi]
MSQMDLVSQNLHKKNSAGQDISLTTQFVTEEELEKVNASFHAQRRLSFSFGIYFFLITLLIPFLSGTSEWWYGTPLIFGLTLNFWTTLLLFHIFYWVLAFIFVKRANRLEDQLNKM